ncbi:MAG: HAD-IA family hydrolase [Candidatus Paracaedibacteraceae bacterium]|nr:HAD-IA family hydrolase [Candidatus Paracaedibacteraceae bacterium]
MPLSTFPKAVLFDWDNTLVDTWPLIHGAMRVVFEKRSLTPWTIEQVKERCHESGREAFPKMFPDSWRSALDDFYAYAREHHIAQIQLLPFAQELIKHLVYLDIPIVLVSNKTKALIVKEVDYLQLTDHFVSVIGAGDAVHDKPNAAPVQLALERLGIEASMDVWMIGDTPADWSAAKAAGVCAIGVGGANIGEHAEKPHLMCLDLEPICNALGLYIKAERKM